MRRQRGYCVTLCLCTRVETVWALPYNGGTGIYSTTYQYGVLYGLKEYEFY